MFFSDRCAGIVPNISMHMNSWKPISRCACVISRRTVSGLPQMMMPRSISCSIVTPPAFDLLVRDHALQRFRTHVAGREEHQFGNLRQKHVEHRLDVRPRLLDGLLVGVGDVDGRAPADPIGLRLVAVFVARDLAIKIEIARNQFARAVGLHIDVFARGVGGPFDRLEAAARRTPDRRMRLLEGARPEFT